MWRDPRTGAQPLLIPRAHTFKEQPMATISTTDPRRDPLVYGTATTGGTPSGPTAVSWGAIFAGAAAAAALSLILMLLGTGLGLSAMSPWANEGTSAKTLGIGPGGCGPSGSRCTATRWSIATPRTAS